MVIGHVVAHGLTGDGVVVDAIRQRFGVAQVLRVADAIGLDELQRQARGLGNAGHFGRVDEDVAATERSTQGHGLDAVEVELARKIAIWAFAPSPEATLCIGLPCLDLLFVQTQEVAVDLRVAGQTCAHHVRVGRVDDGGANRCVALKIGRPSAQVFEVGNHVGFWRPGAGAPA